VALAGAGWRVWRRCRVRGWRRVPVGVGAGARSGLGAGCPVRGWRWRRRRSARPAPRNAMRYLYTPRARFAPW